MYKRRVRLGDVIKRFVLIVVVIAGVAALGAKFLAGYRVRSALDELTARLAPVGDLSYLDVSTTYDGKVHIKGMGFYPDDAIDMDPLITQEAVLLTPGMLYLLGLEGGPIPSRMGISLIGLWVDLAGLTGLGEFSGGSLSGNPFEALACGEVDSFQAPDLHAMGYPTDMRMDLHLRYQMMGNMLSVVMEQSSLELAGFGVEVDVEAPGVLINPLGVNSQEVKLARMRINLDATEFNKRRNRFCADREGVDENEFIDRNVQLALEQMAIRGIEPSAETLAHYRAFIAGQGSWNLETNPVPPVALADAPAFDADQLIEWLNINSTIDGERPTTLKFDRFRLVEEVAENGEENPDSRMEQDQRVVVAQQSDPWINVPISEIGQLTEQRVRLYTSRAKEYVGFLTSSENGQAVIETRVPGGMATIPIPLDQIDQLQVRQSALRRMGIPDGEGG